MRELLKRRNLETQLRNERFSPPLVTLPLPPLCSEPHVARRRCKHWITQQYTTPLSRMSDSGFIGETEGSSLQFSSVRVRVRNREFTLVRSDSYKWSEVEDDSSSPWEDLKCDWKTFFVYNISSVRLL
jgi:hypothetical protein